MSESGEAINFYTTNVENIENMVNKTTRRSALTTRQSKSALKQSDDILFFFRMDSTLFMSQFTLASLIFE